jgi:hypothetical protein
MSTLTISTPAGQLAGDFYHLTTKIIIVSILLEAKYILEEVLK